MANPSRFDTHLPDNMTGNNILVRRTPTPEELAATSCPPPWPDETPSCYVMKLDTGVCSGDPGEARIVGDVNDWPRPRRKPTRDEKRHAKRLRAIAKASRRRNR